MKPTSRDHSNVRKSRVPLATPPEVAPLSADVFVRFGFRRPPGFSFRLVGAAGWPGPRMAAERLSWWERPERPLAPLSERQRDSVLELRGASPGLPLPPEVGRLVPRGAAQG